MTHIIDVIWNELSPGEKQWCGGKPSSRYLLDTSKEYSIYVCSDRAIPYATDGLKDVQRKALWLLRNKGEKIKTVSLAGEMISSNLYVHGDASASDAVSMLAAPYLNNIPLIEGIGTFGTRVAPKDGIGAPRYTYVKKSKITQELVYPDLDIVPLKENYDGSNKEPETFLPIMPLLLLNGVSGIAVGWSTDILPRKPSDIVDACISALDGEEIPNIQPFFTYLDLYIHNIEGNKYLFSGKIERLDSSTLRVCELPPDLSLEKFKERLNQLEDENVIRSYNDNSTRQIDVEIKFPRGSLKKDDLIDGQVLWTDDQILDTLKLRQKSTERIVVIGWDGKSIQQYDSVSSYIRDFVSWRLSLYTKRYEKLKKDVENDLLWLNCLKTCFEMKFSNRINSYKNKKEMVADIKVILKGVSILDDIPERISGLPGYRWTTEAYNEVLSAIKEQEKILRGYEKILTNEKKIKLIYRDELVNLKKTLS